MKKTIFALLCAISAQSFAVNYMYCKGADSLGHSVSLTGDLNNDIINLNGNVLRIVGSTNNGQGVVTEKYINIYGTMVYDSLVPVGYNAISIYTFNAITQALLYSVTVNCTFSLANGNVFKHKMFNKIN